MSNGLPGTGIPNPEVPPLQEIGAPVAEQPEAPEVPEASVETAVEQSRAVEQAAEQSGPTSVVKPAASAPAPTRVVKDEVLQEVEKVLEEGLEPFYKSLPEDAKPLFRQKGEQAAKEISEMVRGLHVQVKRVLELIYLWLKTIPGVNKFFLEQEAKIKTDRIVQLVEERKKDVQ